MAKSIREQEQQHLDHVVDAISKAKTQNQRRMRVAKKDSATLDKQFGEIHMNTGTYSGMMDTAMSVRTQQQMLDERENSWQHAHHQYQILERLEKNPYFARVDFQEEGAPHPETIYIGLASFSDRPDHFLVYDWRAPISSIYYEGKLGRVTYQTPDGEQAVNISLKRQFQIKDGQIVTIYDTDEQVGDSLLLAALGTHSDTKMKSIVATIQRTQNEIIRDTANDLLFVQGGAGTGKTAAVLQRVAWLLYRYRGNLTSSQVILFSPNQLFNDYIDTVLPELGEHNMVQMTYYQYVNRRVPHLKTATLEERFEASQNKADQLLGSLAAFKATRRYAKSLGTNHRLRVRDIKLADKVFIKRQAILDRYYGFNHTYTLRNRFDGTVDELMKNVHRRIGSLSRSKMVEQQVQNLSQEQLNMLYAKYPDKFANENAEGKFLSRLIAREALKPVAQAVKHNHWFNINAQYIDFLRAMPKLVKLTDFGLDENSWRDYVDHQVANLRKGHISADGISVYLYLYDLVTGRRGQNEIRYLFVDEVQDYTAYQLAYLKFCFPRAKFTLLGDLNQAIFTHENSRSLLSQMSRMFDPAKTKVVQLTKSYRSTKQITNFTRHLLTHGEQIEPFDRNGDKPTVVTTNDQKGAVSAIAQAIDAAKQKDDAVAVIARNLDECEQLHQDLQSRGQDNTIIRTENQRLVKGTIVVPSYLAKGLEFDAVIVADADAKHYRHDSDRQLLYTVCSRAMHSLTLVSPGQVSPLLDRVPKNEYTSTSVQ